MTVTIYERNFESITFRAHASDDVPTSRAIRIDVVVGLIETISLISANSHFFRLIPIRQTASQEKSCKESERGFHLTLSLLT